nr:uncharacterized protein LOC127316280 [Lolium perenne]
MSTQSLEGGHKDKDRMCVRRTDRLSGEKRQQKGKPEESADNPCFTRQRRLRGADLGGRRELQRRWQRSISLAADRQRLSVDCDWGFGGGGDPPACTALREDHPIRGVGAVAVGVYARWVRSEATSCSSPRRLAQRSCNLQRARAVEFVPPPCLDTKVGRTCQMPCFIPLSHCVSVSPPQIPGDEYTKVYYGALTAPLASPNSHLLVSNESHTFVWRVGSHSWLRPSPCGERSSRS